MGMVLSRNDQSLPTTQKTVEKLASRGVLLKDALVAYQTALEKGQIKKSVSTADFWKKVLKPLTQKFKLSYVEYLNKQFKVLLQPAQIHVVHSWSMRHCDTLMAAAQAVNECNKGPIDVSPKSLLSVQWHEEHKPENLTVPVFICTYVVNQYTLEEHSLGSPECEIDKFDAIADKIYERFGNPMVVATDEENTTLSRSLCLQEIYTAMKANTPLTFRGATSMEFCEEVDARVAGAYDKEVRRMIYEQIEKMPGGFDAFNKMLNESLSQLAEENIRLMEQHLASKRGTNMKDMYLFIGNPGTGKSTILNGLIASLTGCSDTVKFKSGVSYGRGLTTALQTEIVNGEVFMDTPGLADTSMAKKAAEEITKALQKDGTYHIFFVIVLDSGRVRPQDTATMKLVLESAPIQDYAVIINQVGKKSAKALKDESTGALQEVAAQLMTGIKATSRFFVVSRSDELDDEDDVAWTTMPDDLKEFIKDEYYTSGELRSEIVDDIAHQDLQSQVIEQEELLQKMRQDQEFLERELERQEESKKKAQRAEKRLRAQLARAWY